MDHYAIAAFRSRQAVLRFDDELRRAGLVTHMITTPRAISMGCGLSVRFDRRALPIAMEIYRAHPIANLIGFYEAQQEQNRIQIQPIHL